MATKTQPTISLFRDLKLSELRKRTSVKWRMHPDDVLPLWVAEMDAYIAQPIIDAVHDAMVLGDTGYPFGPRLQTAISSFAADRWHFSFESERAIAITDVMTGVLEATRQISKPDDPVILTPPIYPPFKSVTQLLNREIVPAHLTAERRLDPDQIEAAFKQAAAPGKTPILLLSNPHNPSGTVNTQEELQMIAQLARRYGGRVVADEIHAPLTMPSSTFVPYLSVADTGPDISLISASKGWNLAGFKAAIMIAGTDAVDEVQTLNHRVGTHPGHIGVIAHSTAYNEARDWLDAAVAGIDENRKLLAELLKTYLPQAHYTPPEATYLAWIDFRDLGLGDDPAKLFLDLGKVAVNSGLFFGDGGEGFVRFNLATSPAIITEAVERMAKAVASARG